MHLSMITMTPRDRRILAWIALVVGVLLTAGGLAGVWLQGMFYEGGFPTAATFEEVRSAFTWPTMFTTLGTMVVTGILLASPLTAPWSSRRRLVVFICFCAFVLATSAICGHLATKRVANILN
jgi:hypothetical protein